MSYIINPTVNDAAVAAAQLATDQAAVLAAADKIQVGHDILEQAGTLAECVLEDDGTKHDSGVLVDDGTYYELITTNAAPTATVTSKAATSFVVVSVTALTNTFVVTGDARAQILKNLGVRLAGSVASDGFYTVTNADPVFAAGVTTFLTVQVPAGNETTGTVNRTYDFNTASSWVGGVVPVDGDVAVIPSTSDVTVTSAVAVGINVDIQSGGLLTYSASQHRGSVSVESGGVVAFIVASGCPGNVIVKSGGLATFTFHSTTDGSVTVESGGSVVFDDGSESSGTNTVESGGSMSFINAAGNWAGLRIESSGSVTFDGAGSNNVDSLIVESGGSVTFTNGAANTGNITKYLNATVTGATAGIVSIGTERRTVHCATPV